MAISTNQKPTIYRNLYENTAPAKKKNNTDFIYVVFVVYLCDSFEEVRKSDLIILTTNWFLFKFCILCLWSRGPWH